MSMQPPPDADDTLDREERELAALYRQLPQAEPDATLDARILARADGTVARRPRRFRRLLVGLGSFSAVAMAAGLTWHMMASRNGAAATMQAPAPQAAQQAAASNSAVRFRILPDAQDERPKAPVTAGQPALAAKARDRGPSREVAAPPPPRASRLVVPVRILPSTRAPAAATAAGAKAVDAAQAMSPQALIDAARKALARHDTEQARTYVGTLVREHPDVRLPGDLAALAPAPRESSKP